MRQLIVKEGPTVFVSKLILTELLAGIIFFCVSFLANYEDLYESYGLISLLRYDLFIMVTFSVFQIVLILYLFLHWYFSYFTLSKKSIEHISGLVRRKTMSIDLSRVDTVVVHKGLLDRVMQHATIVIYSQGEEIVRMNNVPRYHDAVEVIRAGIYYRTLVHKTLREWISYGENSHVEYKETLRFDIQKNTVSRDLEKATLKTIAGFMNAEGGTLLIGIADQGTVMGLSRDYGTLQKKNKDGFENYLSVLVKNHLGIQATYIGDVSFENEEGKDVCVVRVAPAHEPVFLEFDGKEEFFVRMNNTTQPLSMSEAQSYIASRFR